MPRAVERLDEVPELLDRTQGVATRAVAGVGGEERDRRIPPVVDQARRAILPIELEHGHELDRGDPEILEIRDLLDHSRVGAAQSRRDARAGVPREARHVHLVDHRGGEGPAEGGVALPVVSVGIHDHAPHGDLRVVARAARRETIVPVRHDDGARIGIEKDFRGIVAEAARRVEGTGRPVRVDLSGAQAGHERVPVVVGAVGRRVEPDHAGRLGVARALEEQQLQGRRVPREDTEVDAALHGGGAQREALAGRDVHAVPGAPPSTHGVDPEPAAAPITASTIIMVVYTPACGGRSSAPRWSGSPMPIRDSRRC